MFLVGCVIGVGIGYVIMRVWGDRMYEWLRETPWNVLTAVLVVSAICVATIVFGCRTAPKLPPKPLPPRASWPAFAACITGPGFSYPYSPVGTLVVHQRSHLLSSTCEQFNVHGADNVDGAGRDTVDLRDWARLEAE